MSEQILQLDWDQEVDAAVNFADTIWGDPDGERWGINGQLTPDGQATQAMDAQDFGGGGTPYRVTVFGGAFAGTNTGTLNEPFVDFPLTVVA